MGLPSEARAQLDDDYPDFPEEGSSAFPFRALNEASQAYAESAGNLNLILSSLLRHLF